MIDHPFGPGGAAVDVSDRLTTVAGVTLADRTPRARFGLKGLGADAWFGARLPLPEVNVWTDTDGLRLLRLGTRDIVALAADSDAPVHALQAAWADAPEGHSSWREETWAWLRLDGPGLWDAAARLTSIDLRTAAFGPNTILQTRFAHQDAVLLRAEPMDGLDILFDVASASQVATDIHAAMTLAEAVK